MNHKNGRWALLLTIVVLTILANLESASAHLPSQSSGESHTSGSDLQALEMQNSLIRPVSALPEEGGIYVSSSVSDPDIIKYIDFFIHLPIFRSVVNSSRYILISSPSENTLENFVSVKTGSNYLISLRPIITAMNADGYFAEAGDYGIINVVSVDDKTRKFAVLFHEMVHGVQFSGGRKPGIAYNFNTFDITAFETQDLGKALRWVQGEIEAHLVTAKFLMHMLRLEPEKRDGLFAYLGISPERVQQQALSELAKYLRYEQEESKIIEEAVRRARANRPAG